MEIILEIISVGLGLWFLIGFICWLPSLPDKTKALAGEIKADYRNKIDNTVSASLQRLKDKGITRF